MCLHIKHPTKLIPQKRDFQRRCKELNKMTCNYTVRLTNTFSVMGKTPCVPGMWHAEGRMVSWALSVQGTV